MGSYEKAPCPKSTKNEAFGGCVWANLKKPSERVTPTADGETPVTKSECDSSGCPTATVGRCSWKATPNDSWKATATRFVSDKLQLEDHSKLQLEGCVWADLNISLMNSRTQICIIHRASPLHQQCVCVYYWWGRRPKPTSITCSDMNSSSDLIITRTTNFLSSHQGSWVSSWVSRLRKCAAWHAPRAISKHRLCVFNTYIANWGPPLCVLFLIIISQTGGRVFWA